MSHKQLQILLSAGKYPQELQADYSMELDPSSATTRLMTPLQIIGGAINYCNCVVAMVHGYFLFEVYKHMHQGRNGSMYIA